MLFRTFQRVHDLASQKSQNLNDRHARIGGLLEEIIEDLLVKHYDGDRLQGKDVAQLAKALKDMQEVRRTANGEAVGRTENQHITVELDTTEAVNSAALAISDALGLSSRLLNRPKQRLEVQIGDAVDAEYEET